VRWGEESNNAKKKPLPEKVKELQNHKKEEKKIGKRERKLWGTVAFRILKKTDQPWAARPKES